METNVRFIISIIFCLFKLFFLDVFKILEWGPSEVDDQLLGKIENP